MVEAPDLQPLPHSLWLWQAYDPTVRCDLFSSAALTVAGLVLIDPIPLTGAALSELTGNGVISAVVVTNANHVRAAEVFATRFGVPVLASPIVLSQLPGAETIAVAGREKIGNGLTTMAIEGAVRGEIALHLENEGGTIVIGDALINFEPFEFALLPPKYCSDQKVMRRSLRQLLDVPFERLLFAHGVPILSSARARLEALLADDR
jgi:Metallo-beta-lactamase superfamily